MRILRLFTAAAVLGLVASPVIAHHAAEGIVDEEIYAIIDAMVAVTPPAELDFSDMGGGTTQMDITTPIPDLEDLVAAGLLRYAAMLDGDVSMTIEFSDRRNLTVTIMQVEDLEAAAKAAPEGGATTLGDLKARFR